jgi:hypothetical protein
MELRVWMEFALESIDKVSKSIVFDRADVLLGVDLTLGLELVVFGPAGDEACPGEGCTENGGSSRVTSTNATGASSLIDGAGSNPKEARLDRVLSFSPLSLKDRWEAVLVDEIIGGAAGAGSLTSVGAEAAPSSIYLQRFRTVKNQNTQTAPDFNPLAGLGNVLYKSGPPGT